MEPTKLCRYIADNKRCPFAARCTFSHDKSIMAGKGRDKKSGGICHDFQKGSCKFGARCRYTHTGSTQQASSSSSRGQSSSRGHSSRGGTYTGFGSDNRRQSSNNGPRKKWNLRLTRLATRSRAALAEFQALIDEGLEVLDDDSADNKQELIRELGSDYGLIIIRRIVEGELSSNPQSFALEAHPFYTKFIRLVSHEALSSSLMLEKSVGTIYNIIYGSEGTKAIRFFERIIPCFENTNTLRPDIRQEGLSSLSSFLLNVIKFNSDSLAKQSFPEFLRRIKACCSKDEEYRDALGMLQEAEERLNLGSNFDLIKTEEKKKAQANQGPSHGLSSLEHMEVDLPGNLSGRGPRHDNDHEAISDIAILPTTGEITSDRNNFLPLNVVGARHHLEGIYRVFDTQFRLLREDTTGPLRDAVRMVFDRWSTLSNPAADGKKGALKKRTIQTEGGTFIRMYHNVMVSEIGYSQRNGLSVLISFDQPTPVNTYPELNKRVKWWEDSKEFQEGSLLAMVNEKKEVTFLLVSGREVRATGGSGADSRSLRDLASSQTRASITMTLADPGNIVDAGRMFHSVGQPTARAVLVDFPGMLFASFQPVLKCLQNLHLNPKLPFSNWLQQSSVDEPAEDILPPKYLARGNVTLSLRCITKDGSDLSFSHRAPPSIALLREKTTLDEGQSVALLAALQRELALIQGPPGTGKSYVGIQIAKILWANKRQTGIGPILCVCYTNHALDQFLEELLDAGIPKIVRLGSRSKSERIQEECLNLRSLAKMVEATRSEKQVMWQVKSSLEEIEEEMREICMKANDLHKEATLKDYLFRRYRDLHDVFYEPETDQDGWTKARNKKDPKYRYPITTWAHSEHTGGFRFKSEVTGDFLSKKLGPKIFQVCGEYRKLMYNSWISDMQEDMADEFLAHARSHVSLKQELDVCYKEKDQRGLEGVDVIGVTTTGLATNSNLLRLLKAKVLICEEAAEVLEAHVLTALLPSVEHAILIGDHLQLRPQIATYGLSAESRQGVMYRLDESLFERLAKPKSSGGGGMPVAQLDTQRRMHPSISELVRSTLYPSLKDYPTTAEYPQVVGMRKRLFWLDHRHFEDSVGSDDPTNTSKTNTWEVDMVMALVRHIMRQGVYKSKKIAVLTPYLGQLRILRKRMSDGFELILDDRDQADLDLQDQMEEAEQGASGAGQTGKAVETKKVVRGKLLDALRIATVDNFQGEEADIIIISLVRSNPKNICGFLKTSNRINVLLSRARHGMYIVGNSETSKHIKMWGDVLNILATDGNIGESLDLTCPRHPEKQIIIKEADDFVRFAPEGGCDERCDKRLNCGHPCVAKCHSTPMHDSTNCMERCPRQHPICGHSCPKRCYQDCGDCLEPIFNVELPCGHVQARMACYETRSLDIFKCRFKVEKPASWCSHVLRMDCYQDPKDVFCNKICGDLLPCGHSCRKACGACRTKSAVQQELSVVERHPKCSQKCGRNFTTCSHACNNECHSGQDCLPCDQPCTVACSHSKCPKECSQPCPPCASACQWSCPHQEQECQLPCSAPCSLIPCSKRCEKKLSCGHQCPSVCGEACPSKDFCKTCAAPAILEQVVDMVMFETYKETNVDEDPVVILPCKHMFTVSTLDGQLGLSDCYEMDAQGVPVKAKPFAATGKDGPIKGCPNCRASLRSINRYNRITKKAILDESTKKFITEAHMEYQALCSAVQNMEIKLEAALSAINRSAEQKLSYFKSNPETNKLVHQLELHQKKCSENEQPYGKVRGLIIDAIRKRDIPESFQVDNAAIQTTCTLRAKSLILQFDLVRVTMLREALRKPGIPEEHVEKSRIFLINQINRAKRASVQLIQLASAAESRTVLVEGGIYWANFSMLSIQYSSSVDKDLEPEEKEKKRLAVIQEQTASLENCLAMCAALPGTLGKYKERVEKALRLVKGGTFYVEVSDEERKAVYAAMSVEFRGTGHWYRCENGHPFTIGECGMPMQLARCPECGAQVGGQNHTAVDGITRDTEMESAFARLNI
ncbi:hypothetical protein BJ508DRAFT_228237 [Ascobolus immersus RN42]|uniref:P-loop containing nucleoside triphosphate hydrolase protein n=1 Tax=Ascobolus immersus RN42 TaxID=1160509 RepID=A0A3N4HX13_ASCIM|nr:hypothetical protein BJ508DRAFT_228237 [Ascobolus immersus RN42]